MALVSSLRNLFSHIFLSPVDLFEQLKPKYVSPVVAYLCHESCEENGGVFEAAGGWVGKYRWSRAQGKTFIPPDTLTPEAVKENWSRITDMRNSSMPASVHGKKLHFPPFSLSHFVSPFHCFTLPLPRYVNTCQSCLILVYLYQNKWRCCTIHFLEDQLLSLKREK